MILRRNLLALPWFCLPVSAQRIPRERISYIADEVARTPAEAIAFARRYGLRRVELRSVPGTKRGYWDLPEAEQASAVRELADNGLLISFIDSGLLACPIPGTTPVRKPGPQEAARFTNRMEDLRKVIGLAQRAQCGKIRCFSFRRVAEPVALFPRIAEFIAPMAEIAAREGVQLLLENESSCNVNTCVEIEGIMKLLPATVGLNWDPGNASGQERAFPEGYRRLPVGRIGNVQIKGKSILGTGDGTDWPALFRALEADGYRGYFGLETHTSDRVADSHPALERILKMIGAQ